METVSVSLCKEVDVFCTDRCLSSHDKLRLESSSASNCTSKSGEAVGLSVDNAAPSHGLVVAGCE